MWFVKAKRAQNDQDDETWVGGGVVPTLNQFDNGDSRATVIIFQAHQSGEVRVQKETSHTLSAFMGTGGNNTPMVSYPATVRRLTPMECERLQGFPDGWTTHRVDEQKGLVEQADSSRYKQMGNAVAVPVVEWIIGNLVRVETSSGG